MVSALKLLPGLESGNWTATLRGSEITCDVDPAGGVNLGVDDGRDDGPILNLAPEEARRLGEWLVKCADVARPLAADGDL